MKGRPFWLKAAAAVVVAGGLCAAAALAALRAYFPEARLRALAVDAAKRQLGRDVKLEAISVGLTGVKLKGLEISESPGFGAGTFLRVDLFRLRPSWRALLKRRLVVAAVSVDGIQARVVKLRDGRFNYETLASSAPAPAAQAPAAPGPELKIRRASLSHGSVDYLDQKTGDAWRVSDISLDVDGFGLAEPFAVAASARARGTAGSRPVDAKAVFAGRVDLARGRREGFRADIKRLDLSAEGLALNLSGKVARLDAPELSFDAALAAGGKDLLAASGSAKMSGRTVGFDVKAKTPGLDTTLLAKLAPSGKLPAVKLPAAELSLAGQYAGERADIKSIRLRWAGGKVDGSGSVRGLGGAKPVPEMSFSLALDLPAFKGSDLPVQVTGVPPTLSVPPLKIDGGVRIAGDDVRLDGLAVKAKDGHVRINGGVAKALAGAPQPDVDVEAELSLPPLSDKDLPFAGVPAGLSAPASRWTAVVSYSPKAARVRSLRLQAGRNDVEVSGSISDPAGRGAFDLLVKCRSFVLEELTQLTPRTRDMKLAGSGFFALSVTGTKDKPAFAGKLQFKGLGATVAGLPLSDFAGTLSVDERRADLPNLTGKVADGTLKLDLTAKDYSRSPEIQIDADLDRFDLGRYLAAKAQVSAQGQAAKAAKPSAGEEKPKPLATRGRFHVGTLVHPNARVSDVSVGWDLRGLTSDMRDLGGDARLSVGGGSVRAVGDMATQSKVVKVLLFPLLIVQKLGRIGGIQLFPDFNNIELNQIVGDYLFKDGVMTLRRSEMSSSAARVSATGTIDLPREALDLVVTAQVARVAPIDVAVTGSFDQPKPKLAIGKFLADPAKQLLNNLLRK